MKLVVGLGNPGLEYSSTRHNMGFMAIDSIAHYYNITIDKNKFNGLYNELIINNEKYILLKPLSYMNLSGEVVKKYVDYFNILPSDILVISDDLDMPLGKIRLKQHGSAGGHNGLKNIELHLKSDQYKKLKLGIGNNKEYDTKDFVLGKFSKEDKIIIEESFNKVVDIFKDYTTNDFTYLMNKYN